MLCDASVVFRVAGERVCWKKRLPLYFLVGLQLSAKRNVRSIDNEALYETGRQACELDASAS